MSGLNLRSCNVKNSAVRKKEVGGGGKILGGERELRRWIEQAEYEVNVDPYRGMQQFSNSSNENCEEKMRTQEVCCSWRSDCTSNLEGDMNDAELEILPYTTADTSEIERTVREVCNAPCPTLINWTTVGRAQNKTQRRRKIEPCKLGKRLLRPSQRCACDYNPFCLSTLGGAMDDILQIRLSTENKIKPNVQLGDNATEVVVVDSPCDTGTEETIAASGVNPPSNTSYSNATLQRLERVRKSKTIDESAIVFHLRDILQELSRVLSVEHCVARVRALHDTLVFDNPLQKKKIESKDGTQNQVQLSIPPGIENLGATCYLNTQLQCLAQNRVFMNGILSWRPKISIETDRMTSILSLFQDLLVRMRCGPEAVVNTLNFSDALGLDHYEQQDPNEFSRLLLDRIHESFRHEKGDLAELLPHLFQGIVLYETSCSTCKNKTTRTEKFMDLNLPIEHPSFHRYKKRGQQTLEDSFSTINEPDVQFCFGQYCRTEMFEGDNQYLCSKCGCKRDATRELTFQKLPPVLNVQLSRYVFDREKLIKKKLTDKVVLSKNLVVPALSKERKEGVVEHRYVLCAVMRHKGISAYSGHYVAEAMDWLTGQWFEFNDDKVVLLEKGPSCSVDCKYDTGTTAPSSGNRRRKSVGLSGSPDAYNMYYIEEKFMAQSILDDLKQSEQPGNHDEAVSTIERGNIARSTCYSTLTKMCMDDQKAAQRLEQRRGMICKNMFPDSSAFQLSNVRDTVWVANSFLLKFMSCSDRLDEDFASPTSRGLLKHKHLLCIHDRLHPRVARKGKLIPKSAYEAYIKILAQEWDSHGGVVSADLQYMNDCVLHIDRLICQQCSYLYQRQLAAKLEKIKLLKSIYDSVGPKSIEYSLDLEPDECWSEVCNQYAFIVSRRFITSFRNYVTNMTKQLARSLNDDIQDFDDNLTENKAEHMAEGLDFIDLSLLDHGPDTIKTQNCKKENIVDMFVNSNITCSHGGFDSTCSKASYRYVSGPVWQSVSTLFTAAVEHKIRRNRPGSNSCDDYEFGCKDCKAHHMAEERLKSIILDLIHTYKGGKGFKSLDGKYSLDHQSTSHLFMVHKGDIDVLQQFSSKFKRAADRKHTGGMRELAKRLLFPIQVPLSSNCSRSHENATVSDRRLLDFLSRLFRRLLCTVHCLPIHGSLFSPDAMIDNVRSLNKHIAILGKDTYNELLAYSVTLFALLDSSNDDVHKKRTASEYISESKNLCDRLNISAFFHPSCRYSRPTENIEFDRFSILSNHKTFFQMEGPTCQNPSCSQGHPKIIASSDPTTAELNRDGSTCQESGEADNPIDIDSGIDDVDDKQYSSMIRVFDILPNADTDDVFESLSLCLGLPSKTSLVDGNLVRRSSRKRKTRFPEGAVLEEEAVKVDLRNNIAALRLTLLERCTRGTVFELDHSLHLLVNTNAGSFELPTECSNASMLTSFKSVKLGFDQSNDNILDIVEQVVNKPLDLPIHHEQILLLRQGQHDPSSSTQTDGLLTDLLELSNVKKNPDQKKKQLRRAERGFHGTFLLSGAQNGRTEKMSNYAMSNYAMRTTASSPPSIACESTVKTNAKSPGQSTEISPSKSSMRVKSDTSSPCAKKAIDLATVPSHNESDIDVQDKSLVSKISLQLLKILDIHTQDESISLIAAEQAVRMHPQITDVSKLIDQAYSLYLELTLP